MKRSVKNLKQKFSQIVHLCYPINQALKAFYEFKQFFFKNLLVLPLSEKWSYGEKVDELHSTEEAETDAKPNAPAKLSWNYLNV